MISRMLKDREVNYVMNERELLAIVWALDSLCHYLYGKNDRRIYTDISPLSSRSQIEILTPKLRWKAQIEESGAKVFYKPGKENYVTDGLSRQNINILEESILSDAATAHSEVSLTHVIEATDKPLNCFRNQIIVEESSTPATRTFILFGAKIRHQIIFNDWEIVLTLIKEVVKPDVVNAIHCELTVLARIQDDLVRIFPATKFGHCKNIVTDVVNKDEQKEIVTIEHNRAHRAAQENLKQILLDYYFPKIGKIAAEVVVNCKVCGKAKYDRHFFNCRKIFPYSSRQVFQICPGSASSITHYY